MLNKIPELFDRKFAVGFFLPCLIFLVASVCNANYYEWKRQENLGTPPKDLDIFSLFGNQDVETIISASLLILSSWIGGILLVALNRELVRFMEGYGKFNPLKIFRKIEIARFYRVQVKLKCIRELRKIYKENREPYPTDLKIERKKLVQSLALHFPEENKRLPAASRIKSKIKHINKLIKTYHRSWEFCPRNINSERNRLMQLLVERFPSKKELLLPTSFGNTMRSFEEYPLLMYGADSIVVWEKLLAVIPKDYRDFIENSRAQLDFWVNLWCLSILLLFEYSLFAYRYGFITLNWKYLSVYCFFLWIVFSRATSSANRYGKLFKSAFDLFLSDLRVKLGFQEPSSQEEAAEQWQCFNQGILYVKPNVMPTRNYGSTKVED
jgi:hypothetical protein